MRALFRSGLLLAVGVMLVASLAGGELLAKDQLIGATKFDPDLKTLQMFDAIEQGKLDVKVITKGASQCRLLFTNNSQDPFNVAVPEAFAVVPIMDEKPSEEQLAQQEADDDWEEILPLEEFLPPYEPPPEGDDEFPPKEPQSLGVGNSFAKRAGYESFKLTPGTVAQLRLKSVCLHSGRSSPRPAIRYEVRPLRKVSNVLAVYEIVRMMGQGEVSHRAAQMAAWHLNNGLTWEHFAQHTSSRSREPSAGNRGGFLPKELTEAKRAVQEAVKRTQNRVT